MQKAVALLEYVIEVQEKTMAAAHPDRLASQHALAGAYRADGQVQKAVALLEPVVTVEAFTLRDDHPSRLVSVKALTDMYAELAVNTDEALSVSCESFTVS